MPRSYKPIQQHEKEILKMREEGKTNRQIGEKLGFISCIEERIHNNDIYSPIYDAVWYLDLTKYIDIFPEKCNIIYKCRCLEQEEVGV